MVEVILLTLTGEARLVCHRTITVVRRHSWRACMQCSENLVAASAKKESVEADVFEQRYNLAIQRASSVQLERCVRDATSAVSRLLDVRTLLCSALLTRDASRASVVNAITTYYRPGRECTQQL